MDTNRKQIVYGCSSLTQTLAYFLRLNEWEVAAFTVDARHLKETTFDGAPVCAFEDLPKKFAPDEFDVIVPLGWSGMNALRTTKYKQAKAMGYKTPGFIAPLSRVLSPYSENTNTVIYGGVFIHPFVTLGDNITLSGMAQIGHHSTIGNDVFIAMGVTMGGECKIGNNVVIGLGAILRSGITVGDGAFIGMGSVVTQDVPPNTVYVGNPAREMEVTPAEAASSKSLKAIPVA
jgi:sugar O-acyltransferase (sialic acid O-acetyltransferase NeuD family)